MIFRVMIKAEIFMALRGQKEQLMVLSISMV